MVFKNLGSYKIKWFELGVGDIILDTSPWEGLRGDGFSLQSQRPVQD